MLKRYNLVDSSKEIFVSKQSWVPTLVSYIDILKFKGLSLSIDKQIPFQQSLNKQYIADFVLKIKREITLYLTFANDFFQLIYYFISDPNICIFIFIHVNTVI